MILTLSKHAKERIIERDDVIATRPDARKAAKQAFLYGKTINDFAAFPEFFDYLVSRRDESNTCSVRIYNGNIYIWKGKRRKLITAHPIPDRFIEKLKEEEEEKE